MMLLVMQHNEIIKSGVMKVFSHQNVKFYRKKEYTHSCSIYIYSCNTYIHTYIQTDKHNKYENPFLYHITILYQLSKKPASFSFVLSAFAFNIGKVLAGSITGLLGLIFGSLVADSVNPTNMCLSCVSILSPVAEHCTPILYCYKKPGPGMNGLASFFTYN